MARVEGRVQDVDDERRQDERRADEDDDALEDVVVALQDRLDREAPEPGNAEDVLDDHGAAERVADDQAEHRQERPEGVPKRVPAGRRGARSSPCRGPSGRTTRSSARAVRRAGTGTAAALRRAPG